MGWTLAGGDAENEVKRALQLSWEDAKQRIFPVCPGLRDFLGHKTFSVKTGKVHGQSDEFSF